MANKVSKPSNQAKKPGGKGPMAVDKSQTPAWMRMVIIIVALSFAVGGVAIVWAGATGGSGGSTSGGTSGGSTSQFQQRVESAQAVLSTSPDSPDAMAEVGHAYFDWAVSLYESGQQSASVPVWRQAVDYYDQSLAIKPDNDVVLGNKAFSLYYAWAAGGTEELAVLPDALRAFISAAEDNAQLSSQVDQARTYLTDVENAASQPTTTTP